MRAFFILAAVSRNQQRNFRALVAGHLVMLALLFVAMLWKPSTSAPIWLGQIVLVAGIIEGALLLGWRLTQLPKSQALEFLLVSSLRPAGVLLAEACVGLTRLAFVTAAGLPIYFLMVHHGIILAGDVPVLMAMPLVFGGVAGLGLTAWAYETAGIRRWGNRLAIAGVLVYLVVGVLAGERLGDWLRVLPFGWGADAVAWLRMLHDYNPFGAMQFAMEHPSWAWARLVWVLALGIGMVLTLLIRCALRLHGHFHDEHYRPNTIAVNANRPVVGDEPLSWWAVQRVSRYSGSINVWLAGGFGVLYAAYTIAGDAWPAWMGRGVFEIFDRLGGLPLLATALMLLATVPAAFQYGLWDGNRADRCRRLELLLLTDFDELSYWRAAMAAAWRRGRGYFLLASMLFVAAALAERITWIQACAGIAAGALLWGFYFTLGFRAFARGTQANRLGVVLTLLIPLATGLLASNDHATLARLLPPGSIYFGSTAAPDLSWVIGPVAVGTATLLMIRHALRHCDAQLRAWYDQNHGVRAD